MDGLIPTHVSNAVELATIQLSICQATLPKAARILNRAGFRSGFEFDDEDSVVGRPVSPLKPRRAGQPVQYSLDDEVKKETKKKNTKNYNGESRGPLKRPDRLYRTGMCKGEEREKW